jgi:Domain of unknown function (DUF4388)
MEGDLSLLSIPDLLQMICLGGYSRDIHLFDGPTQLGVIAIRNGRVDRCFGFGAWGEAAFFKLVNLRRGRYKVNDAQDMEGSDATLTAYSWQELLMEAARQQDEAARVAQSAAASAGRVIPFPTPSGHSATVATGFDGPRMEAGGARESTAAYIETQFDFPAIFDTPAYGSNHFGAIARSDLPRPSSDTGRHSPITVVPDAPVIEERGRPELVAVPAAPVAPSAPVSVPVPAAPSPPAAVSPAAAPSPPEGSSPAVALVAPAAAPPSTDSTADDVTNYLQEATACYLRRDLARAEELLQKCLELRPGDKRALQNLERIRRKKSP